MAKQQDPKSGETIDVPDSQEDYEELPKDRLVNIPGKGTKRIPGDAYQYLEEVLDRTLTGQEYAQGLDSGDRERLLKSAYVNIMNMLPEGASNESIELSLRTYFIGRLHDYTENPSKFKKDTQVGMEPVKRQSGLVKKMLIAGAFGTIIGLSTLAGLSIGRDAINKPSPSVPQPQYAPSKPTPGLDTILKTEKNVEQLKNSQKETYQIVKEIKQGQERLESAVQKVPEKVGNLFRQELDETEEQINEGFLEICRKAPKIEALQQEFAVFKEIIKKGYDEMTRANQEGYRSLTREIREIGKTDPEPVAPSPTADEAAERLLSEVEGERVVPVEQPKTQDTQEPEEEPRWSVGSFYVSRQRNDKDDIGPYTGAGVRVAREFGNRLGGYVGLEFDSASDTQKTDISKAELKSKGISLRGGGFIKPVKTRFVDLEAYVEGIIRHEENTGNIQVLDAQRDISDTKIYGGWGAGGNLILKPTKNLFIFGGIGAEDVGENGVGTVFRLGGGLKF